MHNDTTNEIPHGDVTIVPLGSWYDTFSFKNVGVPMWLIAVFTIRDCLLDLLLVVSVKRPVVTRPCGNEHARAAYD